MKHHVLYIFIFGTRPVRRPLFSYILDIFDFDYILSLDFVWCTGLPCAYIHFNIIL